MKTLKNQADAFLLVAVALVVIGCIYIVAALYARAQLGDRVEMFRSGNWSIQELQRAAKIQTANDLVAGRERFLYQVACKYNEDCICFLESDLRLSNHMILAGLAFAVLGGMSLWRAVGLRRQIAEHAVPT